MQTCSSCTTGDVLFSKISAVQCWHPGTFVEVDEKASRLCDIVYTLAMDHQFKEPNTFEVLMSVCDTFGDLTTAPDTDTLVQSVVNSLTCVATKCPPSDTMMSFALHIVVHQLAELRLTELLTLQDMVDDMALRGDSGGDELELAGIWSKQVESFQCKYAQKCSDRLLFVPVDQQLRDNDLLKM